MKFKHTFPIAMMIAMSVACDQNRATNNATNAAKPAAVNTSTPEADLPTTASPAPTPRNGDYSAKGVVTKIDTELGSVELNHQEIKDLMPAMKMEFFVSDKSILDGLSVGDEVDFVIRYRDRNETIVKIRKAQ